MDVKKTELKDTELNELVLHIEECLEHYEIEDKAKCDIMIGIANIVTECVKNPPSLEDGFAIHKYCQPYALQFAELSDNPILKLMTKMLLS